MSKSTSNFWVDITLFVLLIGTIVTFRTDLITHSNIHVYLGLLLCATALLHLGLHWKWIKNAFQRYDRITESTRENARLNLYLFSAYFLSVMVGLIARAMPFPSKHHIFLGVIHVLLAVSVIVLQVKHIIRHWIWIKNKAEKVFGI